MTSGLVILLTGLCWTYKSANASQLCDNGKFQVELDLPHPSMLHCSETLKDLRHQIATDEYSAPLQPVKPVCMDTPIVYNATIPSRGDYRPVAAEPGVYLYCPPQRWLNNLQHGSIVVLHHPCAAEEERSRLAALALSCLPGFIMTPHPWLSQRRPLALVSWGRTLEMSRVTSPEVCDWLVSVSSEDWRLSRPLKRRREHRYSLLLMQVSPLQRPKETTQDTHAAVSHIDWLKNLRSCCEQTLSSHDQNRAQQMAEETTSTQELGGRNTRRRTKKGEHAHRRRRRAALPARQPEQRDEPSTKLGNTTLLNNETDLHTAHPSPSHDSSTPSIGVPVNSHLPAVVTVPVRSTEGPGRVTAHLGSPKEEEHKQVGAAELKTDEEEAHRGETQVQGGGNSSSAVGMVRGEGSAATAGAGRPSGGAAAVGGGGVSEMQRGNSSAGGRGEGVSGLKGENSSPGGRGGGEGVSGMLGGNSSTGVGVPAALGGGGRSSVAAAGGGGGGVQRKVTGSARTKSHSSSSARSHSQSHRKEKHNQVSGGGGAKTSARQRVREDTEEQERLEGLEQQEKEATQAPWPGFGRPAVGSMGGGGGGGDRFVTPRTDEAVWAAAALGFLLVLLTLSVLHTRLYRHWRTAPSLYWRDDTQDYDSVTDIIRRRLKLAGRRKRRAAPPRRHEAPLISYSSTDDEFD